MPDSSPPRPGDRLGRYRLLSHLGSGGMGVVYLAEDERLGREVAVKFLPEAVAGDAERLQRFEQEAVAASKLNHPNIVVVHELGEESGRHFLVTERVEGSSLRERLDAGPMPTREAIEIAAQVAAALAVAHKAGIVHRDVKPENLMLRPDGWVKLLDFGLAKLGSPLGVDSQVATMPGYATAPGVVLGTVRYMSPEQARGEVVDARSDLFSLGAVLYEMVCGRPPFSGPSAADVLSSVLREQPAPIDRYVADAPESLAQILSRCLRKSPLTRYQSAEELLADLRALQAELQSGTGERRVAIGSAAAVSDVADVTETRVSGSAGTRISSRPGTAIDGRRWRRIVGTLAAIGAVAAAAVVALRWLPSLGSRPPSVVFENARLQRVTQDGRITSAILTPDARYVLYAIEQAEQWSIRLRQIRTGTDVEIVPASPERSGRFALSPDGEHLFFVRGEETGVLFRVPVLGGTPVQLVASLESPIAFSPAGDRFAYYDWNAAKGVQETVIARSDGTRERTLVERPAERALWPGAGLAWHPDGNSLAVVGIRGADQPGNLLEILSLPLAGGEPSRLGSETYLDVQGLAWRPDGLGLVAVVKNAATGWLDQLCEMTLPDGELHPITSDLESYDGVTLTADGRQLLTVRTELTSNLWTVDGFAGPGTRPVRVTQGGHDGALGVAWTADGAIVHIASDYRLYRVEPDGRDWLMTPDDNTLGGLTVCPSGDVVVSSRRPVGASQEPSRVTSLWRLSSRGTSPRRVELDEQASPDAPDCGTGDVLVYRDHEGPNPTVFRAAAAGGARVRLDAGPTGPPSLSPDSTRVAFFRGYPQRIVGVPLGGGPPLFALEPPPVLGPSVDWAPDGQGLVVVLRERGVDDLWRLPIDGGPPIRLTDFGDLEIFAADWREDGKLVLARGGRRRDAVLLTAAPQPSPQ